MLEPQWPRGRTWGLILMNSLAAREPNSAARPDCYRTEQRTHPLRDPLTPSMHGLVFLFGSAGSYQTLEHPVATTQTGREEAAEGQIEDVQLGGLHAKEGM